MIDYDQDKNNQINQIIQIIKVASLSLPAIAFLLYNVNANSYYIFNYAVLMVFVLTVLIGICMSWILLRSKISAVMQWMDPVMSIAIAFTSVMLTGTYLSSYKFLFLFVIISSSIERSMKVGLTIAGVSAALVLGIDLIFAPAAGVNVYFESDLVLAGVFMLISWTIGFYVNLERHHIEKLKELAKIDGLTGLFNHRYFYDQLADRINESRENNTPLALLFIDIDYFKYYNDLYGHQKGDEALKIISQKLRAAARERDIISRYGGEEFAVILPDTTEKEAIEIAEKIRRDIQEEYFVGQEYMPDENLTVSVGISVYPNQAKSEVELVKYADDALYRAKFLRKNRVEAYFSILDDLQNDIDENDRETLASIKTLIAVINARDKYTFRHIERVVSYCTLAADKLKFDDVTKRIFIHAAYIHDVGKINIPQEILIKSTPLTDEEWEMLKKHPQNAVEIIKNVSTLKDVVPVILQHHERYDGTGYPNRVKGNDINYLARLLAVIDSFDAMTSNRPYQKRKSYFEAINELQRCSGTQFDPELVKEFIAIIKENYIR